MVCGCWSRAQGMTPVNTSRDRPEPNTGSRLTVSCRRPSPSWKRSRPARGTDHCGPRPVVDPTRHGPFGQVTSIVIFSGEMAGYVAAEDQLAGVIESLGEFAWGRARRQNRARAATGGCSTWGADLRPVSYGPSSLADGERGVLDVAAGHSSRSCSQRMSA